MIKQTKFTNKIRKVKDNMYMKTIKFYPSNRSLIRLDGKMIKGYKINDVPYERNSWFNYKGLTFVID